MNDTTEISEEFDFIVVGSGAGGGPLASRLALNGHSVLLLEAGDDHQCPYYSIPIMQAYASEDPDMRWGFFVHHYSDRDARSRDSKWVDTEDGVLYPRGSTLGGSTAVSAMVTIYPHESDWANIAALTGDDSWSPESMREIFERLEDWRGVDPEPLPGDTEPERDRKAGHGRSGWLTTTRAAPSVGGREPMFLDIIDAMERTSRDRFGIAETIPLPRDPNALDTPDDFEGMTFIPVAVRDGHRNGARERIEQVRALVPHNLTVRLNSLVTKVVFDGTRATGVEYRSGNRLYSASAPDGDRCRCDHDSAVTDSATEVSSITRVAARKEVILAGGAYNTPQLLKLSGIGPRAELERLGIDVLVDAPGVGANLHDRYEVSVNAELDRDFPIFTGSPLDVPASDKDADDLFREWNATGDGPYSTNGSLAAIIAKSSVAQSDSDLIVFSLPIDFRGYYPGYSSETVDSHRRLSLLVLKGHTNNRAGTVTLRSTDPTDTPAIDFRYFEEGSNGAADDLDGVVDGIEIARDILDHLGAAHPVRELVPGDDRRDRDSLRRFVRDEAWGHHACGTAKIGADDDPAAVLTSSFEVRGTHGLRVVDASIFPDIPGFFIASAVYMISEKAATAILADHPCPG